MCCMLTSLVFLGPRAAILIWWLVDTDRWKLAFDSFFVAFLGFLFVPWTTLMYVVVAPGGVEGFDWVWMILAILVDIGAYTGGAYGNRGRTATA